MVSVVTAAWFPIAAAPALPGDVSTEVRFVLEDRHSNAPDLHECCEQVNRLLVTAMDGCYPHTDDDVEVRQVFHTLRSIATEHVNEHTTQCFA